MTRRTNQGGSVASFIVIGVIMVVGLVSTVYLLNQRGQQARKEQTIATSTKNQTTKSTATKTKNNKSTKQSETKTKKLPATGIELSLFELIGTYSLTASVTAYALSRRPPLHSL